MKTVLIVQEGQYGFMQPDDYKDQIRTYVDILSADKEITVEVVATAGEAEEKIRKQALNQKTDVVIFISRGMADVAEKFAAQFSRTKVVVLTGLLPEGKVIWVHKMLLTKGDILRNLVLW